MRDVDKMIGVTRRTPWTEPHGNHDPPRTEEFQRASINEPALLADDEPEGLDTMSDLSCGPAQGIVVALVPALTVWAALIALVVRLLR